MHFGPEKNRRTKISTDILLTVFRIRINLMRIQLYAEYEKSVSEDAEPQNKNLTMIPNWKIFFAMKNNNKLIKSFQTPKRKIGPNK